MLESFYEGGEYDFLLNAERTLDIDSRWICFDLSGVLKNKRLTAPVLLMVIQLFENGMQRWYGNRCRIFLEEAIDFLQGGFFADYISGLYRKIRKMGGQVMIVTQSISFLDKLDPLAKASILSNTFIRILLDHSNSTMDYPALERDLSLSKSEMELLKNQRPMEGAPYRLGFMKFGNMAGFVFRVEVSKKTYALYQTNASEIKIIDDLIKSYGVDNGVQNYIEQIDDNSLS
jgi:type IV secretory pathway VirB4 component